MLVHFLRLTDVLIHPFLGLVNGGVGVRAVVLSGWVLGVASVIRARAVGRVRR